MSNSISLTTALDLLQRYFVETKNHVRDVVIRRDPSALWKSATIGVATCIASCLVIKSVKYVVFGPIRQFLYWKLTAASRAAFAKTIVSERDRDWQTLVDWAASNENGCDSPTKQIRHELAELSIVELRQRMLARTLSPVLLLKACVLNADDAQKLTNCISAVVLNGDEKQNPIQLAVAMERRYAAAEGGNVDFSETPLLGIPMSVKECLKVAGTYATAGCFAFANDGKSTETAATVQMLRAAGAIIFCKTNVPQTMLSYDCRNNIYGDTCNPHNVLCSPGGSSGGEAALVASRGSIAGIGTDIGGSNRIPNAWCGVFGLRPSLWRVPSYGAVTPVPGQESITSTAGPVGKCISDLAEVFRAMVAEDAGKIDGLINSVPFRDDMFNKYADSSKKKLKIGFFTDDGFLVASPACRRAVLESVEKLKAAGHEVTEFDPKVIVDVMHLFFRFVAADGCDTICTRFDGVEPPMAPVVVTYLKGRALPDFFFRSLIPFFVRAKSSILADGLAQVRSMDAAEFFAALKSRNDLRHEFARAIAAFDCVVSPVTVIPAPRIGAAADKPFGISYTAAVNVLDQSCVVIPTNTFVDAKADAWTSAEVVQNNSATKQKFDLMDQKMRSIYDSEEMAGLPLAIQVLTPRGSEERALGCADQIVKAIGAGCPKPKTLF